MKLKLSCSICNEPIEKILSEFRMGPYMKYEYQCGHGEMREAFKPSDLIEETPQEEIDSYIETLELDRMNSDCDLMGFDSIPVKRRSIYDSLDGTKSAYAFQIEGVKFAEKSNFNCLIADEMGLGKTIQSALTLKTHKELWPCIIIVKGATLFQWPREIQEWVSENIFDTMVVTDRCHIVPGFKFYVISQDFISRKDVLGLLLKLKAKSVIIDECQSYKDSSSKRTIALIELLQQGQIEHKIALSGTPIKNRANEYFVILNLLAPAHFTSFNYFCKQWLLPNDKGVYTRLNPIMEESFKRLTSRWIIRRETKDVAKDLPEMRINYQYCEISDEAMKRSYNHQLDLFENYQKNESGISSTQLLGWLAKLRAITGQAKVPNAVNFVREFLDNNEEDKIAVGIHHHVVRDTLKMVFESDGISPLSLSGEDDAYEKTRIVERFKDPKHRVLVMNSIAGGVGLNLQMCNNFIALERQWNGADEDQFHKRFHRDGQTKKVTGTYFIAKGTIDEFFHDMVWTKRNNLASVNIGEEVDETQSLSFLREFSEFVVRHKI